MEFLSLLESWEGYGILNGSTVPPSRLARFMEVLTNAERVPSHRHEYRLRETMTTSDFPALFGLTLDHSMLARYRTAPSPWRKYVKVGKRRNFNASNIHKVQGNQDALGLVREKDEYPQEAMSEAFYTIQVQKYGRAFDISWEATINDVLNAMNDIPERFAQAALNTEARLATSLYCGAVAPNATLFGAPILDVDGGSVTNIGNLPLNIANLGATLQLMSQQQDIDGNPLSIRGVHLVVPPALEITARQALTSAYVQQVDVAGGANAVAPVHLPLPTNNVLPQMGLQLHVDPWIPIVMPVAAANRTWFVFADMAQGTAMEIDFLTGHEGPEICMKAPDKMAIGGGSSISPLEGDFASDSIKYRVRHCMGGAQLDPRYAYAQVGP